jgi:hypothetical protein
MNAFNSFLNGFIYTALLFLFCLSFIVGVKWLFLSLKTRFFIKREPKEQPKPQENTNQQTPKEQPSKPKKTARTIEINTDGVDKIYFKKSS